MGILHRLMGRETRSASAKSSDPYLAEFFGMRGAAGLAASPDAVLSNLAVAARCVSLRSEMLASIGLFLFRRTADGGRERADNDPLYAVLHDGFNDRLSAYEGREMLVRSLDLHGNAYARIERNGRGEVVALYPLEHHTVGVEKLASGRLRYRVSGAVLLQEEMLHVRGASKDGVLGLSPLQIARGSLALALSQNETAAALVGNGLRPSGVMSYPDRLSLEAHAKVKASLTERFAGASNAGKVMVVDGGAKFEHLAWSPEDAEFLDNRRLANLDVARIFGCPPTTVGIPDHGTYSNQEQEATALVRNALGPLAARIEGALARCLLTPAQRRALYIEHDLSALLRGDVKARFEAYRIGREIGALSPNDIRRRENEPPIPDGDTYHQPANWVPLGTVAAGGNG